jgi:hypothetical protein
MGASAKPSSLWLEFGVTLYDFQASLSNIAAFMVPCDSPTFLDGICGF